MVNYTIDAIETTYKGINFRSKLEAKWAVFFDLCGWRWEYEPINLNGWYPDFALYGEKGNEVFVEVKPVTDSAQCWDTVQKMMKSCEDRHNDLLLLGVGPFLQEWGSMDGPYYSGEICIGWAIEWRDGLIHPTYKGVERDGEWVSEVVSNDSWYCFCWANFGVWNGRPGFCSYSGVYNGKSWDNKDFISGLCIDGYKGEKIPRVILDPRDIWAEAVNTLQYEYKGLICTTSL